MAAIKEAVEISPEHISKAHDLSLTSSASFIALPSLQTQKRFVLQEADQLEMLNAIEFMSSVPRTKFHKPRTFCDSSDMFQFSETYWEGNPVPHPYQQSSCMATRHHAAA